MENGRIAAIILAAGLGSRMGFLKPMLKTGSNILISHLLEVFCDAGIDTAFIVLGYRGEEIKAAVRDSVRSGIIEKVRFVFNKDYRNEMFASVRSGAVAVCETFSDDNCCGAFIIPADYPLLKTETVARLAAEARQACNRGKIIYPMKDGIIGHPPFINMSILRQIPDWKQGGGLRAFLEPLPQVKIDVDDSGVLEDMDTPEQYAELLKKQNLRTYPAPSEALQLLKNLSIAEKVILHGQAVGVLALEIANLLSRHGCDIDGELVHSAGILHDIGKGAEDHALEGFQILMARAFPDAARIVRVHMNIDECFIDKLCPESIVYLADKMTLGDKYITLANRKEYLKEKMNSPEAKVSGHRRMNNAEVIYKTILKACSLRDEEFCELMRICLHQS